MHFETLQPRGGRVRPAERRLHEGATLLHST
jgi:hypothetical protein